MGLTTNLQQIQGGLFKMQSINPYRPVRKLNVGGGGDYTLLLYLMCLIG